MKKVYVALDMQEDHEGLIGYLKGKRNVELEMYQWTDFNHFSVYIAQLILCLRLGDMSVRIGEVENLVRIGSLRDSIRRKLRGLPDLLFFDPDIFLLAPEFKARKGDATSQVYDSRIGRFVPIDLTTIDRLVEQKDYTATAIARSFVSAGIPTIIAYSENTEPVYHALKDNADVFGVHKPYENRLLFDIVDYYLRNTEQDSSFKEF